MDMGLKGRVALVMGAGGGLGSAIARALADEGASVALADIDPHALAKVAASLANSSTKTLVVPWDLVDAGVVDDNIARIEAALGPVDILVNNTGGPAPTPALGQDAAVWQRSFEGMVLSVIRIADRVVPSMRERKWGRVVTSTSSGVVAPIPNLGITNALRLSLVGWSKTLAREIAPDGVTCNVIVPGRIATPRIEYLDRAKAEREGRAEEDVRAESTGSIPMKRYGKPDEYARSVVFLASGAASYITGTVLRVDGGLIASI